MSCAWRAPSPGRTSPPPSAPTSSSKSPPTAATSSSPTPSTPSASTDGPEPPEEWDWELWWDKETWEKTEADGDFTPPPPIAPDVLAGMNAEATQARRAPHNVGPSAPVAFLIHGGTVPVEVSRDVIIGRDPDARALTGRPVATVLRVPSPATEISRSHCAVMMTAPGAWSLMDLGSANGTILRHADGSFQDVTPMVTIALNDGDLIDVGEGTTIEFRVR